VTPSACADAMYSVMVVSRSCHAKYMLRRSTAALSLMKRVSVDSGIATGALVRGGNAGKRSSDAVSSESVGVSVGGLLEDTLARRRRSASGVSVVAIVALVWLRWCGC
jgi:hypothetical protein